jgi:NitT/TauT family transport system substrate-binding protein
MSHQPAEGWSRREFLGRLTLVGTAGLLGLHARPVAADLFVSQLDGDKPVMVLAGLHGGCYELFGSDRVRSIRHLHGKTIAVPELGSGRHLFIAILAVSVGLDPRKDIRWVERPTAEAMQLFTEGKLDAFLGFPPEPQELRAKQIGHVVVNTALDRPWSQYSCCMVRGNQAFVRSLASHNT